MDIQELQEEVGVLPPRVDAIGINIFDTNLFELLLLGNEWTYSYGGINCFISNYKITDTNGAFATKYHLHP